MEIILMWIEDCHILYICPLYSLYLKAQEIGIMPSKLFTISYEKHYAAT